MFQFKKKPSSRSHSQCLAKITILVQCCYRRRADVVSAMAAYYAVELPKHIKIMETAPTCFGLQRNHHQGPTASA